MLEALSTIAVCFALLLAFGWLIRDNGPNIPKRGWWNVNEDGTYRDSIPDTDKEFRARVRY